MRKFIIYLVFILLLVSCSKPTRTIPLPTDTPKPIESTDSILPAPESKVEVNEIGTKGNNAYGIEIYPHQKLVYWSDINIPSQWDIINESYFAGTMYVAGDFVGTDYTTMYVISYTFNDLRKINVNTGFTTIIGKLNRYDDIGGWTGMAGAKDGTCYLTSTNGEHTVLYTVDLQTAETTVIGVTTDAPVIIDIAITANNIMYGLDIRTDSLFKIDINTGQVSLIGPVGFDANYSQDMDYDDDHNILYLAAYNRDTFQGELRMADTNTGMSTLVGPFPNGDEIAGFSIVPHPKTITNEEYLIPVLKDNK